jgi:hypothetical protein
MHDMEEMIVVFIVCGLPIVCGIGYAAFKSFLSHRIKMAQFTASRTSEGAAESPELRARCEALEKRCEKLEEQLLAVQHDLIDERRKLDLKLATMLPDAPTGEAAFARRQQPVKTIQ